MMESAAVAAPGPQLPLWEEGIALPSVSLRHSRRARRIAVRIAATGAVELVVPRGVSEHRALAFLQSQSEWIGRHVARRRDLLPAPQAFPPPRLHLALTGETWRLFQAGGSGRPRIIAAAASAAGADAAAGQPGRIDPTAVGGGAAPSRGGLLELRGSGTPAQWRRLLLSWLKQRAQQELGRRLQAEAQRHGLVYSAMKVRLQRTRWGSCSSRGVISLNLALLFQPAEVVRYLLCHELAHTRHMNHSQRFWRLVAACEPRWRQLDKALLQGWRHVPAWIGETG